MRTLKKICCLLLALSMLVTTHPFAVRALQLPETVQPVSPQHTYETTYGELNCRRTLWPRSTSEESYLADISDAAAVLRAGMKQRQSSITVLHQCDSTVDFQLRATAIFEEACAHTGVATEGDYLGSQLSNMSCSASYYVLDGVAYYTMTYALDYFTTSEQEAEMDVAVHELLDSLDLYDATDYEKLRGVYDWICEYVDYDYANLNDDTYLLKHSAYAALTDKTAVCQGIALLLYRLLLELGVDCRYISGYSGDERHGWNIVRLNDVYYNVDATWDLNLTVYYRYFLCTQDNFPDHTRDAQYETAAFMAAYPMATISYVVNVAASGTLSNGMQWVLDGDTGMLTISGTGAMPNFKNLGAPWYDYAENIAGITLSEGITSVGDYSFVRCKNATIASLPSTLTRIGKYGFDNCRALVEITLPESLKTIDNNAFSECTTLKELVIPGTVTSLGSSICSNSKGLKKITLGEGITTIPNSLCYNCDGLEEVVLPNTITRINDTAFRDCDALETFHFPATITSIGYGVLSDSNKLKSITVDADNPSFTSVDGILFSKDLKTLYCWPAGRSGSYAIPDGTVTIASAAFSGAGKLTSITFPDTLITIHDYAFAWCNGLTEVKLSDSVEYLGDFAFGQCENIKKATLSKNLNYFDNAFYFFNWPYTGCALEEIIFTGDAPTFVSNAFSSTVATVYYPHDSSWTSSKLQQYGGTITWVGQHAYKAAVTAPTCTEQGYTTYTCYCGDSYVNTYVDALGHTEGEAVVENETAEGYDSVVYCAVCGEELSRDYVETPAYIPGDINGDGKVNNRDAARLLQYLAGWEVEVVEAALDANGDGKVNNRDAARILQYLAGWDVELH